MNNKDLNVAQHMVAHCERIERYLNRCNNSLDEFMNDELIQDGVTMQLLAMGDLQHIFLRSSSWNTRQKSTGEISNSSVMYVLIVMALSIIRLSGI